MLYCTIIEMNKIRNENNTQYITKSILNEINNYNIIIIVYKYKVYEYKYPDRLWGDLEDLISTNKLLRDYLDLRSRIYYIIV